MTRAALLAGAIAAATLSCGNGAAPDPPPASGSGWRTLEPGLEFGTFAIPRGKPGGTAQLEVIRIDPERWNLEVAGRSVGGEAKSATAAEWCRTYGLAAAINAGMFATDYVTHVGYLRHRDKVLSVHRNAYRSVAAFDPRREGVSRFRMFDLDADGPDWQEILRDYRSAAQNLRLIRRPGENVWGPRGTDAWSEAALAEDDRGRILFLFCRAPVTMHHLNRQILALGIGVVAAQHLEGGPEAQIYVRAGGVEVERFGVFETSDPEIDTGNRWAIPNVLGIRRREIR
ncbi:MAG TPA: phosphodiester glycosidase family protein [Candidatus Eisenbacteria bacterium]|nr:phosphodiester glycosidase family protein [Candidatus Eisenbacteria bacterium]